MGKLNSIIGKYAYTSEQSSLRTGQMDYFSLLTSRPSPTFKYVGLMRFKSGLKKTISSGN